MIVALLAILKAGARTYHSTTSTRGTRIAQQLRSADARVLLSEEHLLDSLPVLEATVVCVDRDAELIAGCSRRAPRRRPSSSRISRM